MDFVIAGIVGPEAYRPALLPTTAFQHPARNLSSSAPAQQTGRQSVSTLSLALLFGADVDFPGSENGSTSLGLTAGLDVSAGGAGDFAGLASAGGFAGPDGGSANGSSGLVFGAPLGGLAAGGSAAGSFAGGAADSFGAPFRATLVGTAGSANGSVGSAAFVFGG